MSHSYDQFFLYYILVTVQCWTSLSSTCRGSLRCRLETNLWTLSNRSGTWSCSSSPERAAWSWPSLRPTLTWPTLTLLSWQRTSIHRVRQYRGEDIGSKGDWRRDVEKGKEVNEARKSGLVVSEIDLNKTSYLCQLQGWCSVSDLVLWLLWMWKQNFPSGIDQVSHYY